MCLGFCAINTVFPDLWCLPKCLYDFEQGLYFGSVISQPTFLFHHMIARREKNSVPTPDYQTSIHTPCSCISESGKEQYKYSQTEGSEKCKLIVRTPSCLKSAFFFLFWESWTVLHQETPAAAEGQHSQVGLLRNVPVYRLITSFAIANILPSVQRRVMSSTGISEARQNNRDIQKSLRDP